jgi:ABC-type phosphate/phosphonate transport system permease subunit
MAKVELPEGIFDRIMARINTERRILTFKRRLAIFSIGFIGSGIAFIPAFKMVEAGFIESGFLQFFSLLFSDFRTVAAYWQSFIMSLLETLPAISLAIFLAVIFVFLASLRFLVRDIKFVFPANKLIIS